MSDENSSFTLTFAIELLGIDVWHDCKEGWLDLGPCRQGVKVQYSLYPGQNYNLDILIWPHVAKIWCGLESGWVRTWQLLEKRWIAFSISHAFPIRVRHLGQYVLNITANCGIGVLSANAKTDINVEVFIPRLKFGESRYFAPVEQEDSDVWKFIEDLWWKPIQEHIPATYLDTPFDIPHPVNDVRHQDTIYYTIREDILSRSTGLLADDDDTTKENRNAKDTKSNKTEIKPKYELIITGESLLAGVGRIVPFKPNGSRPPELGEMFVVISSTNLPAADDLPVFFVNVDHLVQFPYKALANARVTDIYTQWSCAGNVHRSQTIPIRRNMPEINFQDHFSMPLPYEIASAVSATFLDKPFEIELRGIRYSNDKCERPKLFGYGVKDVNYNKYVPEKLFNLQLDILIATCKVNLQSLTKGNGLVRGEYPIYPPQPKLVVPGRDLFCTNDINGIRSRSVPDIHVSASAILEAQMSLEVCIGLVGCKPPKLSCGFSRLYAMFQEEAAAMAVLQLITEINDNLVSDGCKNDILTGWMIDVGDVVLLYVEGPRDGQIMSVWELTGDYHSIVKTVFSISTKYANRICVELLHATVPFLVLKMFATLSIVLACPPVYVRPALPLPTKSAVLKLGRLVNSGLKTAPCVDDLPTISELRSLRLELCTPKRALPITRDSTTIKELTNMPSVNTDANNSRINWTM